MKYDGYPRDIASMVYKFFDKKFSSGGDVKNETVPNQELTGELHKSIVRKFEKPKVCSSFIDNIWGADLADMKLKNKLDKGIRFLL